MAPASLWGMTPRQSIERECRRRGVDDVVAGARALIRGEPADPTLVRALGGPAAMKFFDGDRHADDYWLRVWGVRALLWAWDDKATPEVRIALTDESWRVREMAFKVIARHLLGDFLDDAAAGRDDRVSRVRQAAHRATVRLTSAEA